MSEHAENKNNGNTVEATLGLVAVVGTYMYIHEQLLAKHLIDVLLAVLVFGAGLIFVYRYFK